MTRRSLRIAPVLALIAAVFAAPSARAQHDFVWEAPHQAAVRELLDLETFYTNFINTGTTTDSFRVVMTLEAPLSWVVSLCEGTFCYAPFVREFSFELAPGDTNKLGTNITAVTEPGRAVATVTVTNIDAPQLSATRTFALMTPGFDALVVAADPSLDASAWIATAVAAAGRSAVAWSRTGDGLLTAADYARYPTVIWATGTAETALGATDRAALEDYVRHGGRLWLNGADLVAGLCSPASPAYSPAAVSWCRDVAGVGLAADNAGSVAVAGVPGDELGAGLGLGLGGGDSAGNNGGADALAAIGGGVACLRYGTLAAAGVRRVYGAGRTVTTGFTLEGVTTAVQRGDLAGAVLDWFVNGPSAVGETPRRGLVGEPAATPNPFNPRTLISFVVGGDGAQPVTITVHDLRGRLVRRLFADAVGPGAHTCAWDGRDDAGRTLAAGVYVGRVQVGTEHAAVKMTLAK